MSCAPMLTLACLPTCPPQESSGKFDLKEPYYRQLTQWYTAAAAVAGAAVPQEALAAVVQDVQQQAQQQQQPGEDEPGALPV